MEKSSGRKYCAWVKGDAIDRPGLSAEFGKFGRIAKIYVHPDGSTGKVYFQNNSDLCKACAEIKRGDWKIEYRKDEFDKGKQKSENSNHLDNLDSFPQAPETLLSLGSFGGSGSSLNNNIQHMPKRFYNRDLPTPNPSNMDEFEQGEFNIAYDFVDSIGRPVEVLENEEGEFYVNLQDIRRNGFQVFRKDDYDSVIITRLDDLREFEAFLLNQAYKFLLERKRSFSENEVLNCIEKVKSRLWGNKDVGRTVGPSSNNNNFKITINPAGPLANHLPSGSGDVPTPTKQLGQNFAPSFSHIRAQPKRNRGGKHHSGHHTERTESRGIAFKPADERKPPLRKPKTENFNGTVKKEENEESWEVGNVQETPKPALSEPSQRKDVSETASVTSGTSEVAKLSIEREQLPVSSIPYNVLLTYIQDRPKGKLYYVQPVENLELVEELLVRVNSLAEDLEDVTPVREGIYLVQFEGIWYRCLMIHANAKPDRCYVELIDYGNKEKLPGPFKPMPEELKEVPAQSVRLKVDGNFEVEWNLDDKIDVIVKRQYDDGTHLVQPVPKNVDRPAKAAAPQQSKPVNTPKPIETPKPKDESKTEPKTPQPKFTTLPSAFATVKQGDEVKILGYEEDKLILMSKECVAHRKAVTQYIQEITHTPLDKVEEGQLVLGSHSTRPNLHRGVVTKLDGNIATIRYLDYPNEEAQLSVKSLRNVDANLAKKPRAILESPAFPILKSLSEKSKEGLAYVINDGKKLVVVLDNGFDLEMEGKKLLSEYIKRIDAPKPKPVETPKTTPTKSVETTEITPTKPVGNSKATPTSSNKKSRIMYTDMPYYQVKPGVGSFVTFCCQDTQNITLVSTNEDSVSYLAQLEITPDSDEPYCPEEMEMCLIIFQDSWCRAAVLAVQGDSYEVLCVDFGNQCTLESKDIRRITKEIAEIPIIGLGAYFVDLPEGNPKVDAKLRELCPDQTQLDDVNIISVPDNVETVQYGIKVPSITEELKRAGLI